MPLYTEHGDTVAYKEWEASKFDPEHKFAILGNCEFQEWLGAALMMLNNLGYHQMYYTLLELKEWEVGTLVDIIVTKDVLPGASKEEVQELIKACVGFKAFRAENRQLAEEFLAQKKQQKEAAKEMTKNGQRQPDQLERSVELKPRSNGAKASGHRH